MGCGRRPGGAGPGSGDAITANVDFGPFRVAPCSAENDYLLYSLAKSPGEPALSPLNIPVEISDQFDEFRGGPLDKILGAPTFLAVPVDTNGAGIPDPATHLVCYSVDSQGDSPLNVDVLLGNDTAARVRKPKFLCLPTTKEILE